MDLRGILATYHQWVHLQQLQLLLHLPLNLPLNMDLEPRLEMEIGEGVNAELRLIL